MNTIKLNDILKIQDISNVKIRFNLMFGGNWNPIETFKNNETQKLLDGHYWNYNKNKSFKEGQITIGLIRIKSNENLWLLFHIGKITKDLNILNPLISNPFKHSILREIDIYHSPMEAIPQVVKKYKNINNVVSVLIAGLVMWFI